MSVRRLFLALSFVAVLMSGGLAMAQPSSPAPKADSDGFVPVKEGELASGEQLPAKNLVAAAYGFILSCLIVWIASVAVRSRKVEEELEALRSKIDKKA